MKEPSLAEWDTDIAPILHDIACYAGWIRLWTTRLWDRIHEMRARPGWETQAEEEIDKAISLTEETLIKLMRAKKFYMDMEAFEL